MWCSHHQPCVVNMLNKERVRELLSELRFCLCLLIISFEATITIIIRHDHHLLKHFLEEVNQPSAEYRSVLSHPPSLGPPHYSIPCWLVLLALRSPRSSLGEAFCQVEVTSSCRLLLPAGGHTSLIRLVPPLIHHHHSVTSRLSRD